MPDSLQVLHVDDNPAHGKLTAEYLERTDGQFEVAVATEAGEGLERLDAGAFDCIVSDYAMHRMNGLEFLDAVREEHPQLPFIFFTGKGSEAVASEAIAAGATDYLQKRDRTDQYELLANRIRNAVEQYRTARERERTIERVTDAVTKLDSEWRVSFVDDRAQELFGIDEKGLVGRNVWEVFPDSRGTRFEEEYRRVMETREPTAFEAESAVFDTWFYVEAYPDDDGGLTIYFQDVTERKQRERQLSRLHETTRELIQAKTSREVAEIASDTADDLLDLSRNGVLLYDENRGGLVPVAVSEAARELFDEVPVLDTGLAWESFQTGESRVCEDVREREKLYDPETPVRSEMFLPIGDHGLFLATSTEVARFGGTDVTLAKTLAANVESALDRMERERELERKTERLDEFASVVSHDLQNPLNTLSMSLNLAEETGESDHFERSRRAVDRMERLIADLLALARHGETVTEVETIDVERVATRCWNTVETAAADLAVETEGTVRADRSRLKQLFENLIHNAVEHGGNAVTVTIGDVDAESGFYVADDGPGVPKDERENIFQSGYSTSDGGTGFGLSIVQEVAETHGWDVTVTDSVDGGARFEITGVETV